MESSPYRVGESRAWIIERLLCAVAAVSQGIAAGCAAGGGCSVVGAGADDGSSLGAAGGAAVLWKMLRNNVRIFEYQPRMLHAKLIICDDWVSVGHNLDRWSFKWNLEANQEIDDAAFAAVAAGVFEGDCLQSGGLSRRHWAQRDWVGRVQERIAGVLDRILDRWRGRRCLRGRARKTSFRGTPRVRLRERARSYSGVGPRGSTRAPHAAHPCRLWRSSLLRKPPGRRFSSRAL